jgi:hypothetical protein
LTLLVGPAVFGFAALTLRTHTLKINQHLWYLL